MTVLKATVKDGKIELEAPANWPDGTEVRIETLNLPRSVGIREEDWPRTLEEIARHQALMEQIEPLEMTAAEEAEWNDARAARKAFEKARFDEHAESLAKSWE